MLKGLRGQNIRVTECYFPLFSHFKLNKNENIQEAKHFEIIHYLQNNENSRQMLFGHRNLPNSLMVKAYFTICHSNY